jgi:hypothetical protein
MPSTTASVIVEIVCLDTLVPYLGQMGGDLGVRQPLGRQRQHHLVYPGQPALPLADDPRLERGVPVPRDLELDPWCLYADAVPSFVR